MTTMNDKTEPITRFNRDASNTAPSQPQQTPARPSVAFDATPYLPFLADVEISESEKHLLIAELWKIVSCFVALGWGVHPAQQTIEAKQNANCGQAKINSAELTGAVLSLADAQDALNKMRRDHA